MLGLLFLVNFSNKTLIASLANCICLQVQFLLILAYTSLKEKPIQNVGKIHTN